MHLIPMRGVASVKALQFTGSMAIDQRLCNPFKQAQCAVNLPVGAWSGASWRERMQSYEKQLIRINSTLVLRFRCGATGIAAALES